MRRVIRYEYNDLEILAVCECDETGNRWYETIRDAEGNYAF